MKIENLMNRDVITLSIDDSVYDAVKIMNKHRIGCAVVTHNNEIAGIVTERDLLERVLKKSLNSKETRISEIMSRNVIVGNPNMELIEATRLMFEKKIKKLPIVKKKRLVGIVTLTDIARVTCVDKKTIQLINALSNMHMV